MRKVASMKVAHFAVDKKLCDDCSLALRRFIGGMDGVDSVDVESGRIAVTFNEARIEEETLSKFTRESIEKLGYKIEAE
jgi:copper chaperone CopZ